MSDGTRTKAVVADRALQRFAEVLEAEAPHVDWVYGDPGDEEGLLHALADADVYVGARLTPEMVRAAPSLRLVQASGAGTDLIAFKALGDATIVANVYEHETSIAEYVLMTMLAMSRELLVTDRDLRQGRWTTPAVDNRLGLHSVLRGRTVGLIGYGHIGRAVARLAGHFGMDTMAVRRRAPDPAKQSGLTFLGGPEDLPTILSAADFLVVVVPLSEETRGLIGEAELALMKSSAYLINVARGPVVQQGPLYEALAARDIAGAALDVWYRPAPPPEHARLPAGQPFHELDNVVMTPHNSGVTADTFRRRAHKIAENVNKLARGERPDNVVAG